MNPTRNYQLTIIIPVYDEEDNIVALVKALKEYLPKASMTTCVLFVNDGSKDSSLEKIKEVCVRNEDFYYISLKHNAGLSAALKAGIDYVESAYLGYMDADLQTSPDDFNLLIEHLPNNDLVMGIRADRRDSGFKKIQSKIANSFRRAMTGDGARDTGCPLKVMKSDVAKKIPFFNGLHRFLPAMVLLQRDCRYEQVPVRHFPRVAGQSKYHLWNRLVSPLIDCFAYRWMRKRYINYEIEEVG